MCRTFNFFVFTFAFLGFAATADAQLRVPAATQGPRWRTTIGINGGIQPTTGNESQTFKVQKNLEDAPVTTSLSPGTAQLIDIGVGLMPARGRLGVNVNVALTSRQFGGNVSAQIPHPFFFNTLRPVSGSVSSLPESGLAVHIGAAYQIWTSTRFDLTGSAGPSFFRVTQDVVTDVTYTETYPYDTATFASAPSTRTTASAWGVNAGADLTWKLSRRLGVGALVRYAHGSVTLTPSAGNDVSANVGGLQLGGGLRLLY